MKSQLFSLFLTALLVLGICLERTFGLPVCSLVLALFLLATLSPPWRVIIFLLGGATLATVYFLPFWFSWLIFLLFWLTVDLLSAQQQHQDLILGTSLFAVITTIAWQTHTTLWGWQLVYLFIQILLIGLGVFYSGRNKHSHRLN